MSKTLTYRNHRHVKHHVMSLKIWCMYKISQLLFNLGFTCQYQYSFQPLVTAVRVFSPLGLTAGLPCYYGFESLEDIKQLSLQWKGPSNELFCHFIKHKAYQNCTPGYSLVYTPNNITLSLGCSTGSVGTWSWNIITRDLEERFSSGHWVFHLA